jgi:hypothetical protein
MCSLSRVAKRGQGVDEFRAAELGFEFPDATHHNALEVCDNGRCRGVGFFEPCERAAKMAQFIEGGHWAGRWWILGHHENQILRCVAKLKVTAVTGGGQGREAAIGVSAASASRSARRASKTCLRRVKSAGCSVCAMLCRMSRRVAIESGGLLGADALNAIMLNSQTTEASHGEEFVEVRSITAGQGSLDVG